jgi:hypothetical protein
MAQDALLMSSKADRDAMTRLRCGKAASAFALLCLSVVLTGCREVPTSVSIKSGPSFFLRGSGRLASFRLYGPQPEHKIATPFDSKSLIWRVQPKAGYLRGANVDQLTIRYGSVPDGYLQSMPTTGTAPVLAGGRVYYFFAETTDAPPAEGFFYWDGATPVETTVPGLCQSGFTGDVKPLDCKTNQPYVEPSNLEQFVRDHRVP